MDAALIEKLEQRARCMLPAETAMMVECRADGGDRTAALLLRQIQRCGMMDEELCKEPYRVVVFDDRVLLRCDGCQRGRGLPQIRGVGYGDTEEEAHRNALYALTLPCTGGEQSYGSGSIRAVESSCIFNRVAYAVL